MEQRQKLGAWYNTKDKSKHEHAHAHTLNHKQDKGVGEPAKR
jgi:hypothetical protein